MTADLKARYRDQLASHRVFTVELCVIERATYRPTFSTVDILATAENHARLIALREWWQCDSTTHCLPWEGVRVLGKKD